MIEDNFLDQMADFEILYNPVENEKAMTAWQYALDQVADHLTSYYE